MAMIIKTMGSAERNDNILGPLIPMTANAGWNLAVAYNY